MADISKITLPNGTSYDFKDSVARNSKTNTSVLPNDGEDIKTKFRISNQGNTNEDTWYYPLCKLPLNNIVNHASARLSGRVGGWQPINISNIMSLIWNRDVTGITLLDIAGSATDIQAVWDRCNIVIYKNSDTTDTVYLKCNRYFAFDVDIELLHGDCEILYNGSYITTTPSGTLAASASTSTYKAELTNGKLYVAGNELAFTSAIPTKTSQLTNDSGFLTEHQDLSAYALNTYYGNSFISVGRKADSTVGTNSFAFGHDVVASANYSHAEGNSTTASGSYSHAEGNSTRANKAGSHAEGEETTANGFYAHAEGYRTIASGDYSHAEGSVTKAQRDYSHAEGNSTTASGSDSHAEGNSTTASGSDSHAEGNSTTASGSYSHAEGYSTTASRSQSHAEGYRTTASGDNSHAEGYRTTASNCCSHASGKYNAVMDNTGALNNTEGTAFVIGNGTSNTALSNAFSIMFNGTVKAQSTITASTTADYAEFFEWLDENPDSEDRVGYFVTMDGDKIRIANADDDYILGVVSGEPFVLGNGDCDTWNGMFLRDEFRRTIYEPAPKMEEILDDDGKPTGEYVEVEGEYEGTRPKLNPDYDHTKKYTSRFDRKEWAPIGMLGVLAVRHDGTAKVNGYVTVADGGIATACDKNAENSYRVIKANTESVVEIIFR